MVGDSRVLHVVAGEVEYPLSKSSAWPTPFGINVNNTKCLWVSALHLLGPVGLGMAGSDEFE